MVNLKFNPIVFELGGLLFEVGLLLFELFVKAVLVGFEEADFLTLQLVLLNLLEHRLLVGVELLFLEAVLVQFLGEVFVLPSYKVVFFVEFLLLLLEPPLLFGDCLQLVLHALEFESEVLLGLSAVFGEANSLLLELVDLQLKLLQFGRVRVFFGGGLGVELLRLSKQSPLLHFLLNGLFFDQFYFLEVL